MCNSIGIFNQSQKKYLGQRSHSKMSGGGNEILKEMRSKRWFDQPNGIIIP